MTQRDQMGLLLVLGGAIVAIIYVAAYMPHLTGRVGKPLSHH